MEMIDGLTMEETIQKYDQMVWKLCWANTAPGIEAEDLAQEARIGIMMAFNTFDPSKNTTFSTWAYNMAQLRIANYKKQHMSSLHGAYSIYKKIKKWSYNENTTFEQIRADGHHSATALAILNYIKNPIPTSLDALQQANDSELSWEMDCKEELPLEKFLSKDDAWIVKAYFGYFDRTYTMEEIGEKIGKSRRVISNRLKKALDRLKNTEKLKEYL